MPWLRGKQEEIGDATPRLSRPARARIVAVQ
jgi:hypothetical protein